MNVPEVNTAEKVNPVEVALQKMDEGLALLRSSDNYTNYLKFMSSFTNYSTNNTLLIYSQKPDATLVSSYTNWKNQGRYIKKGEKGIKIIAPCTYKQNVKQKTLDDDGKESTEEVEIIKKGFTVTTVFDVSSTGGKELPRLGVDELDGTVDGYEELLDAIKSTADVPVYFDDIKSGAKGYFSASENKIVVQKNMSPVQTVKTLIHEIAHSKLHSKGADQEDATRAVKELQSESVAFVVSNRFGLDTSEYSFGYVVGWAQGLDDDIFKKNLDIIRRTSNDLITGIEAKINHIKRDEVADIEATLSKKVTVNEPKAHRSR